MELQGKTALVTGASRGIGRAIALRLAGEGARIIVNYRTRVAEAEEVVGMIAAAGGEAMACGADVSVLDQVEEMVRKAGDAFGPIEVLVNNATIHRGRKVHKLPPADWDVVIKSCLYGAYNCCHTVVPGMIARGWGRIVNISSSVGERGYPGDGAYAAAKAGIIGFTKSLARELAADGIRVTAVIPGYVITEMTNALAAGNLDLIRASIPVGRECPPEAVAELVAFLVCHGDHITGSVHHADGGIGI